MESGGTPTAWRKEEGMTTRILADFWHRVLSEHALASWNFHSQPGLIRLSLADPMVSMMSVTTHLPSRVAVAGVRSEDSLRIPKIR